MTNLFSLLGGIFVSPLEMTNDGWIFLWALPLIIIIAAVYKATKLDKVLNFRFIRESAILAATIAGFMLLIAIALYFLVYILT